MRLARSLDAPTEGGQRGVKPRLIQDDGYKGPGAHSATCDAIAISLSAPQA